MAIGTAPPGIRIHPTPPSGFDFTSAGSIFALDYTPLGADYAWMYNDGYGGTNLAAASHGTGGAGSGGTTFGSFAPGAGASGGSGSGGVNFGLEGSTGGSGSGGTTSGPTGTGGSSIGAGGAP